MRTLAVLPKMSRMRTSLRCSATGVSLPPPALVLFTSVMAPCWPRLLRLLRGSVFTMRFASSGWSARSMRSAFASYHPSM